MYAPQIAWWLQFFSPTQLYVINQDDLASKPEEVLRGVVSFLGLDVPEDLIKLKAKEKVRTPGDMAIMMDEIPPFIGRFDLHCFKWEIAWIWIWGIEKMEGLSLGW